MKKTLWLLGIASLAITMLVLVDTYGLFETNGEASSTLDIGAWKIVLNGTDISLAETIALNDFTYSATEHTEDGYFAPGRSAEFNIVMDTHESEVSVEYELNIDDSILEDYPNIHFSIKDTDTNEVINSNTYSGIIDLNAQNRVKTLTIYLTWDNIEEYDETDTSLIDFASFEFLINANFKQYTGE